MKNSIIFFLIIMATGCLFCSGQSVKLLSSGTKTSLRGLSVVNDKTVWVSGSSGTIGLSVDSGNTWKWMTVKGFEKKDFRDIEAFDAKTAIIMGIDSPAYILKTTDGGENWKIVFEDHTKGIFLDAMEFWNEQSGIVIGDPIGSRFYIARTFNGGDTWRIIPDMFRPAADSGEACFASSGTNVRKLNKSEAVFISGGSTSNLFIRNKKINIPVLQGKETTGTNSIAVKSSKVMMVVGGDFNAKDSAIKNVAFTEDAGNSWREATVPPHGYRSCVEWLEKRKWITCGLTGVDITIDDGKNFSLISNESYHVCRKAKSGSAVYFAGGGGRIGKLIK